MALCGVPRACQCAVRSADIGTFGEVNGTYPTIDVLGDGSTTNPWQPRLNPAWAAALASALAPVPWITITSFGAGWGQYGAPYQTGQYRKLGDLVMTRGLVSNVGAANGTVIFTLPAAYIPYVPSGNLLFSANHDSVSHGRIDIEVATGNVIARYTGGSAGYYSLNAVWSTAPAP